MKIISPVTISDAMLTACNVAENDYSEWSSGTTYAAGAYVIETASGVHKIYESLQAGNIGHDPTLTASAAWWLEISATNRWKMFDSKVGSQTSNATSITLTLEPGQVIDSIAFLDVEATTIEVTMTDPIEGEVYTDTLDLVAKGRIVDGYTYFFEPIILTDAAVLLGIPAYLNASIDIVITNSGGTAKCGTLAIGSMRDLGDTRANPTIGITDYSKKEADAFGSYSVIVRSYSKRMSCELLLDNSAVDELQRILAGYRATPLIWIGADNQFSSMIIYGFYKSFSIAVPYPFNSLCTLEVEGLT